MNARPLLRERVGEAVGFLGAPVFGALSAVRHARVLHPDGVVLRARVEPVDGGGPWTRLGERLRGHALVRFSAALWREGHEHLDALGCALRLRATDDATPFARPGDQDLLFATIRSPMTMPLAPLTTDAHDFLRNDYFATAPFDVPEVGRVKWKLVPHAPAAPAAGATRAQKLVSAVATGRVTLDLLCRRTWTREYQPVAVVHLGPEVDIDQAALRFDPFLTGRDIVPRGFVHALRRGAYAGSQATRPHEGGGPSARPV